MPKHTASTLERLTGTSRNRSPATVCDTHFVRALEVSVCEILRTCHKIGEKYDAVELQTGAFDFDWQGRRYRIAVDRVRRRAK